MAHKTPVRVGNNLEGTRYIFTLPLKDGREQKVTLEPKGRATEWFSKTRSLFGRTKIHKEGSCDYSYSDSDPEKLMKNINEGGFVLCDSGLGINGHQVILDKIQCISEPCTVPMQIDRKQREYWAGD